MATPDRLPPFATLRAFEAAARHRNFSAAAAELHLTPGAVSRQVTTLEAQLGLQLFVREARQNRLTTAGSLLAERVRTAFGTLRDAMRELAEGQARPVVVTALPSFAARWLVPRLPAFNDCHPGIEVDLRPSREVVALDHGGIDLAIRYGRGRWPGVQATRLMPERLFPVCTPALAQRFRPRQAADLLSMPLIHDSDFPWAPFLEAAGVRPPRRLPGIRVDDSNIALQAAERGQGVLLGRSVLVADALAEGRLKRLLRASLASNYAYYIGWPAAHPPSPAADAFRSWLLEAARTN